MKKKTFISRLVSPTCAAVFSASLLTVSAVSLAQESAQKGMNQSKSDMKHSGGEMGHSSGHGSGAVDKDRGSQELMKSMQESQTKMQSMQMKGKTDQDFAEMMRMHHQAGIRMAEIELKHGKDPAMKKMAEKIMASQKKESKEFDAWLQKHH